MFKQVETQTGALYDEHCPSKWHYEGFINQNWVLRLPSVVKLHIFSIPLPRHVQLRV